MSVCCVLPVSQFTCSQCAPLRTGEFLGGSSSRVWRITGPFCDCNAFSMVWVLVLGCGSGRRLNFRGVSSTCYVLPICLRFGVRVAFVQEVLHFCSFNFPSFHFSTFNFSSPQPFLLQLLFPPIFLPSTFLPSICFP